MAYSVDVHDSGVEGERRIRLLEDGVLRGTFHARSIEQALTRVGKRMRDYKGAGLIIREAEITALLEQLRERWR